MFVYEFELVGVGDVFGVGGVFEGGVFGVEVIFLLIVLFFECFKI